MGKTHLTVLGMAYNEERLLPLWCEHYRRQGADRLVVLYDVASRDGTAEAALLGGAEVFPVRSPSGLMDDTWKSETLSDYARRLGLATAADTTEHCDAWVLVADVDEFAYPIIPELQSIAGLVRNVVGDVVVSVDYWQAYRHASEGPIDGRPVLDQRRHGSASPFGQGHWNKPALVNASHIVPYWAPGHHSLVGYDAPIRRGLLRGAHWAMADVDLAIQRRIAGRRDRQSQENYQRGMTSHNWHITEQEIRDECEAHEQDPRQV